MNAKQDNPPPTNLSLPMVHHWTATSASVGHAEYDQAVELTMDNSRDYT